MNVYSSFNQNVKFKHLKNLTFGIFKNLKPENKQLLSKILNIPNDNFNIQYYQSQRAALFDILVDLKNKSQNKNIVILPSYTCCVVVNSVMKAGLKVQFIDTEKKSLNYDFKHFKKFADSNFQNILAALIPANFGESINQDLVDQYKQKFPLLLDLANTFPRFNFQDFYAVLLSFGSNKLIDSVFGGALLLPKNTKFSTSLKTTNIIFELKSIFKSFNFILLRPFLNNILIKGIFLIFKRLNFFPRIISPDEKHFNIQNINYFKATKILDSILNISLKTFLESKNIDKAKLLFASLDKVCLKHFDFQNSTCFFPISIKNPVLTHKKLKENQIQTSLEWTFSQIVPANLDLSLINFNSNMYPNSKDLSNKLLLIPINDSLDFKSISNTIHIIFETNHDNQISNYHR